MLTNLALIYDLQKQKKNLSRVSNLNTELEFP